jgi:hypothetical protein
LDDQGLRLVIAIFSRQYFGRPLPQWKQSHLSSSGSGREKTELGVIGSQSLRDTVGGGGNPSAAASAALRLRFSWC